MSQKEESSPTVALERNRELAIVTQTIGLLAGRDLRYAAYKLGKLSRGGEVDDSASDADIRGVAREWAQIVYRDNRALTLACNLLDAISRTCRHESRAGAAGSSTFRAGAFD